MAIRIKKTRGVLLKPSRARSIDPQKVAAALGAERVSTLSKGSGAGMRLYLEGRRAKP